MGSGKGPIANATKKHELSFWDSRIPRFAAHRDDMQQHMSSYKVSFILDARQALFVKHSVLRESESGKVITKLSVI
eukprot:3513485-Rhodomonas_salina.1